VYQSRPSYALLLGGLLLAAAGTLALSQEPPSVVELTQRIEQLEADLAAAVARQAQLADDQSQREAYLNEIGTQISKGEQLLNAYSRDIRAKNTQAEDLRRQITGLGQEIEGLNGAVANYVVGLYKHGRRRSLEIILSSESFTDAVRSLKGITVVAVRQRQNADRLAVSRDERTNARTEITRTIDALQRRRRSQRDAQQRLNQARGEAASALARIAQDQQQLQQMIQQAEQELATLIEEVIEARRRAAAGVPESVPLGGFDQMRGQLIWPIASQYGPGEIVRGFGQHRGRDNTTTSSPGIDIMAPPAGADIVSVYNGEVLHIGWIAHLGTVIVLWHGDDYATAYSNAENLRVGVGYPVFGGTSMAEVGGAMRLTVDNTARRLLRFSIHKGADTVDPEPWLGNHR
jgi:septal ring factor EnvC (AmiA/AmiB activator)